MARVDDIADMVRITWYQTHATNSKDFTLIAKSKLPTKTRNFLASVSGIFCWSAVLDLLDSLTLEMDKWGIDVAMTGAQKAFAAPPGISPICVNARTKKYMNENPPNTMYFNLPRYFKYYDEAKHTPFTCHYFTRTAKHFQ